MTASWLSPNRTTPTISGSAAAQGWNWGISGIPKISGFLSKVRWYRGTAGATNVPSRMQVWDRSTRRVILDIGAPPDDGTVGWQVYTLLTDLPIYAGHDYTVTAYVDAGEFWWNGAFASRGAAGADWNFSPSPAHWAGNANFGFPETLYNAAWPNVDMEWSDVGGAGGTDPGDAPSIANDLASWLHEDDAPALNPQSLPWLNNLVINAVKDGVDNAVGMLNALIALGIAVRFNDAEAAMTALRAVVDEIKLDTPNQIAAARDAVRGTGNPTIADAIDAVAAAAAGNQGPHLLTPIPGAGWTATAATSGTGPKVWNEPADRYVLHITALPPGKTWESIDGLNYFGHRGWWAPLNGDHVGQFGTMVGKDHELYEVGSRLNGVVIWLEPGIDWELEAWEYTPP